MAIRTLGCKVNRVESDGIATGLMVRGLRLVDDDEADVIIVNTCTVTGEADAKARKAVRQALGSPAEPIVVVTGCLAAIDADALRALGERVVVEPDKDRVTSRVAEVLGRSVGSEPDPRLVARLRTGEAFRTRVAVKVQDGCDSFCTYCIVPHARGLPRSRPAEEIVAEVRALAAEGVREVVLTGINIGKYSVPEARGLPRLCELLAEESGIERIRVSSVEVPGFGPGFLQAMARAPRIVEHFHVPLQSGSDRVLRDMGRSYSAEEFAESLMTMRRVDQRITYTTDVISGFPGETEDDHRATMALVERIGFSRLHVFRFSPRKGTPAAERSDQIADDVKSRRAAELRELDARLRRAFVASRLGAEVEVLVERVIDGIAEGTTREYLHVRLPAHGARAGQTIRVELEESHLASSAR